MELGTASKKVDDRQLLEAEKGLIRLLHAKRFPREWIERHAPEAMAQARTDFAARLAAGKDDETVNLLVVIGYRRALKVLRSEKSRPPTTSIENVFHLADESSPTPEEEAIERDRQERIVKAMGHLPERERRLLALHYFSGLSIREAGRRLGWGKSAADRHHQAALSRLHEMLDRSLLAPEIALPAFIATRHPSAPRAVAAWMRGAGETIHDLVLLRGGHASSVAEAGNAAAFSGAGRTAAGLCGAAVTICLAGAATGVIGPGLDKANVEDLRSSGPASHAASGRGASSSIPQVAAPAGAGSRTHRPARGHSAHRRRSHFVGQGSKVSAQGLPSRKRRTAPAATPQQTVDEFGVERGETEESVQPAPEAEATENTPISPSTQSARPPAESSGGGSGGSEPSAEFGL